MQCRISVQLRLERTRAGESDLDGRGLGQRPQPQLAGGYAHCDDPPLEEQRLVRPQDQILVHHDPHREAGPDSERRLDAHIALGDLLHIPIGLGHSFPRCQGSQTAVWTPACRARAALDGENGVVH